MCTPRIVYVFYIMVLVTNTNETVDHPPPRLLYPDELEIIYTQHDDDTAGECIDRLVREYGMESACLRYSDIVSNAEEFFTELAMLCKTGGVVNNVYGDIASDVICVICNRAALYAALDRDRWYYWAFLKGATVGPHHEKCVDQELFGTDSDMDPDEVGVSAA